MSMEINVFYVKANVEFFPLFLSPNLLYTCLTLKNNHSFMSSFHLSIIIFVMIQLTFLIVQCDDFFIGL